MFAKPSDYAGSSYFKPAEHMTNLALLIEPKTVAKDVPSEYKGVVRVRDEVIADITIFDDQRALDSKTPTTIMKSTKVVHGMLTSSLEKILGGAMVGQVAKVPTKAGSGYAFRDVDPATTEALAAYYTARTEAAASAPSFDD